MKTKKDMSVLITVNIKIKQSYYWDNSRLSKSEVLIISIITVLVIKIVKIF